MGLGVRVAGRELLRDASLTVRRGEILLLAGPSGSGKSVLLRLLAGLVTARTPGFEITGQLDVRGRVGLVFQDFALFTGRSAGRNVEFALDHRRPKIARDARDAARDAVLGELGIDPRERVSDLSGGQKQRVAIARALAYAPDVLAYDEPTSGLDPAMRDRVGERIRKTSREHGTTTVVVSHDVEGLVGIADRVVLFDPERRTLVEVAPEEAIPRLSGLFVPPREEAKKRRGPGRRLVDAGLGFFAKTGRVAEALGRSILGLVPRGPSFRWGRHFLGVYLRAVAGPGALLYFFLAGAVIGLVATYFTFTFLPWREYTESLILDDLIAGLGFGLFRILVPLIMTVLLAARAGAAISADVATRVAGRQTDAMRTLGAVPERYLLTGILWAFLLGTPAIALLSFLGARLASALVFALMAPEHSLFAWSGMFHRLLTEPGALLPIGTGWVLLKDLTSAFGVAVVAYFSGAATEDSPGSVARTITATVIRATVLVLAVHVVFALIEF